MKTLLFVLFAGILLSMTSCEKCQYCRCYGVTNKYCQKNYTPEEYISIQVSCQRNPYCEWWSNSEEK